MSTIGILISGLEVNFAYFWTLRKLLQSAGALPEFWLDLTAFAATSTDYIRQGTLVFIVRSWKYGLSILKAWNVELFVLPSLSSVLHSALLLRRLCCDICLDGLCYLHVSMWHTHVVKHISTQTKSYVLYFCTGVQSAPGNFVSWKSPLPTEKKWPSQ